MTQKHCFLTICLLLLSYTISSQIIDDFSDGNLYKNHNWIGDTSQFIVENEQLKLNASEAGNTSIATIHNIFNINDTVVWEFNVHLDFNPSTSNQVKIHLMSDFDGSEYGQHDLYLELGESGNEDKLYLKDKFNNSTILNSINSFGSTPYLGIKVINNANNEWELWVDKTGGTNYDFEAKNQYSLSNSGVYFGFECNYTATRSDKFYFDNICITIIETIDRTPPHIDSIMVIDQHTFHLFYNEALNTTSVTLPICFLLDNITPLYYYKMVAENIVELKINTPISNNSRYKIYASNIEDISGNSNPIDSITFYYLIFDHLTRGDFIINEILFNPPSGGSDFVELYNNSEKFIDLSNCFLANSDNKLKQLIDSQYILAPYEFIVLTEDKNWILDSYYSVDWKQVIECDLPSYNNDSGTVLLYYDSSLIDKFDYAEEMHFGLLSDVEGVSLERVSATVPTDNAMNWHSAAEVENYGTPTRINSQNIFTSNLSSNFSLNTDIFSPDEDGYQDVLAIHYKLESSGYVGNIKIYDANGRAIKELVNNTTLSTSGSIIWDGLTDNNYKSPVGIYIILLEIFNLEGKVEQFKKTVVIASRL